MRSDLTKLGSLSSLLVLLAIPSESQATVFGSSMTATCVGISCSTVRFGLDVNGDHRLFGVGIRTTSPNLSFTSITGIQDRLGNEVDWWTTTISSDYLEAEWAVGAGFPASEPVYLTVGTEWSGTTAADLTYVGAGCVGLVDCSETFTTAGNVTISPDNTVAPEPETFVLLAIGLALLGGVAFMRTYN